MFKNINMGFLDRITIIKNLLNLTDYAIENKIEMSNGSLQKSDNPRIDKLEKLLNAFPQINAEWLITGNGEPLKKERLLDKYVMHVETNMVTEPLNYKERITQLETELERLKKELRKKDDTIEYNETNRLLLLDHIHGINKEIEELRQQKYNYRKPLTKSEQNKLFNKSDPALVGKRFSPK